MLRDDLLQISDWMNPNSTVLDLGCGNGELLDFLQKKSNIQGYGLELNDEKIALCIERGVNVIHADLDDGLRQFSNQSFDYIVMSHALQAVQRPDFLLEEMLRVGREVIVTFPNFAYWRNRFSLSIQGKMPINRTLPDEWYDTPNIHLCTLRDFELLCREKSYQIVRRHIINHHRHSSVLWRLLPNLLGEIALYQITKK